MARIDLHTHSTASDGSDSPAELIAKAKAVGLTAIALTDHDTVRGLSSAQEAARDAGIEFICGIEISAVMPAPPGELHILGLYIDPAGPALLEMNRLLIASRDARNEKIIRRLAELGMPISRDDVAGIARGVVSRVHLAQAMLARGYVSGTQEAFDKFLGQGGTAYFPKERLTFEQAFATIHRAGGLAVLAHAITTQQADDQALRRLLSDLVDAGLDGVEAWHPDHPPQWADKMLTLAKDFNLCVTGGSDYHGTRVPTRVLGSQPVDESLLRPLKNRLRPKDM